MIDQLERDLRELEARIPELFKGPVCPGASLKCDCTYKSGCKLLTKPPIHGTIRK